MGFLSHSTSPFTGFLCLLWCRASMVLCIILSQLPFQKRSLQHSTLWRDEAGNVCTGLPGNLSLTIYISPTMLPHREGEVFSRATTIPKPSTALKTGFFSLGYTGTKTLLQKIHPALHLWEHPVSLWLENCKIRFKLARQNKEKNN